MISYTSYADGTDDQYGHGTHVASAAAGKTSVLTASLPNQNNGNAPDAKLSFFDISSASEGLKLPPNLNSELLKPLHQTGAAISSHSWGSSSNSAYTVDARSVDQFMWNFPDALVLFAGKSKLLM